MGKFTRMLTLLFAIGGAVSATAVTPPFETTSIVDGQFAQNTKWYSITLGAGKQLLADNGTNSYIALGTTLYDGTDAQKWCVTGDETNGYKFFNKAAGPGKVLASPQTMTGGGGTSYAILKDTTALGTDVSLYTIYESDKISGENGVFIGQFGVAANKMNNYGGNGKLAFWTGGEDAGSTFIFSPTECTFDVSTTTGTFTASNTANTWHSNWASNATSPQLNLNCGANNMAAGDNGSINAMEGSSNSSTYTLSVDQGFIITGYSFTYKSLNASYPTTITIDGKTYTSTSEAQTITVDGLEANSTAFRLNGSNKGVELSNFTVNVERMVIKPEPCVEIFTTKPGNVPYRIPAIATASNGNVLVVSDYRYSGGDIGTGKLDLHYRVSKDNGATWTDRETLAAGRGDEGIDSTTNNMWVGFGDPVAVADRKSSRMLVMSCSGNVTFQSGTRDNHQGITRFYSEDNGLTWSEPIDISEDIYSMFDKRKDGPVKSMFIGSGKMTQSYTTKVGQYFRIYNAALVKLGDNAYTNFVFYSDDFGTTWNVLGGVDTPAITDGDEPKAEELPDGSVLISSRCNGGRKYNIYTFTNTATGEGSWGMQAFSGDSNNGTTAISNSTNGEILIVPAKRLSDGKNLFVALQSLPLGSGRTNVGIYYKPLEKLADYATPAAFAANWEGRHQSSYIGSAYSTMTLQADANIGFVYEESTYNKDYTIVYKNYSLETITDSLYAVDLSFNTAANRDAMTAAGIDEKVSAVLVDANFGTYLGQYKEEARNTITTATDNFKAAPSKASYELLNKSIAEAEKNEVDPTKLYVMRNKARLSGTLYLKPASVQSVESFTGEACDSPADTEEIKFGFEPTENEGEYRLFFPASEVFMGKTQANEVKIPSETEADNAGTFTLYSTSNGETAFICTNKLGGNVALHLAGDNTRLVTWNYNAGSNASFWYVEAVDGTFLPSAIEAIPAEPATIDNAWYDLSGRRVTKPTNGVFINRKGKKMVF